MYCTRCGNELLKDSIYCNRCGQKTNKFAIDENRANILKLLDDYIVYFDKKSDRYSKYRYLQQVLNKRENNYIFAKLLCAAAASIFLIIISFFSCFLIEKYFDIHLHEIIYYSIPFLIVSGVGVLFVAFEIHDSNKRYKKRNEIENEVNLLKQELHEYYLKLNNCLLSEEFAVPNTIRCIKNIIQIGRADNLKEAINIMLDDIHKRETEFRQNQILRETKNISNYF